MRLDLKAKGIFRGAALLSLLAAPIARAEEGPQWQASAVKTFIAPRFSRLDSLFLMAAAGEPRLQKSGDSCRTILIGLNVTTLDYMLRQRLRGQTPRQRHYVEQLFAAISDSGRNAEPRKRLTRALADSLDDTVRVQLLYLGSQMNDSGFRASALPYLASPSEPVRRMAVRSLGTYPHPANAALLWSGLDGTRGLELQQRLWALEAQGPVRDWKRLAPLLRDPYFFNRQKLRDLLLKATDSSWAVLREALPPDARDSTRAEWRLLARDAKGGSDFLEKERPALSVDERRFLGLHP